MLLKLFQTPVFRSKRISKLHIPSSHIYSGTAPTFVPLTQSKTNTTINLNSCSFCVAHTKSHQLLVVKRDNKKMERIVKTGKKHVLAQISCLAVSPLYLVIVNPLKDFRVDGTIRLDIVPFRPQLGKSDEL